MCGNNKYLVYVSVYVLFLSFLFIPNAAFYFSF